MTVPSRGHGQRPITGAEPRVLATGLVFGGVVLATTGSYAAVTMAPVVARDLTGSAFLAGLPVAALLAGAGGGAALTAAGIRRWGRRAVLVASYVLGAAACALAAAAVVVSSFPLLLAGLLGIGVGHAANNMARYSAAEPYAPARRPSVIGWMVWAQAVGSVAGPLLLGPAGRLGPLIAAPAAVGAFALGVALFAFAAALHVLRPRPAVAATAPGAAEGSPRTALGAAGPALEVAGPALEVAGPARRVAGSDAPATRTAPAPGTSPWRLPAVRIAAVAMVTGQVVMLLVMTMTPVHAHGSGHGIAVVGTIMSAHTLGMFALAPLAGRLAARLGGVPVIALGLALLALGALWAAAAPSTTHVPLAGALFLLGLGWSLGFVAGSALLTGAVDDAQRPVVQARVEALTWTCGAAASVASGLLLGLLGFALLCLVSATLLAVPAVAIARRRPSAPTGRTTAA